jgi:hypothetical protein
MLVIFKSQPNTRKAQELNINNCAPALIDDTIC